MGRTISIKVDSEALKILEKRAKKNFMTVNELVEDIVRRSVISYKGGKKPVKVDDRLVAIFSRQRKGPKKGSKRTKKNKKA
jgi:hypothetical protein